MKRPFTPSRLKKMLDYDPESGVFTWKDCPGYNKKFRNGTEAGSNRDRYFVIQIEGRAYQAGIIAWVLKTGKWPKNKVDHKDRDTFNNKWTNLREATFSQNNANRVFGNRSLPRGVTLIKRPYKLKNPYEARIKVNKKNIYLGMHHTPEGAHAAYLVAAKKHFGEFSI